MVLALRLGLIFSNYRSRFAHEVATVRGGLNWKW